MVKAKGGVVLYFGVLYMCGTCLVEQHTLGSAIELPEVLRNTARNNAYYAVFRIGLVFFIWPEYCRLCIVLE